MNSPPPAPRRPMQTTPATPESIAASARCLRAGGLVAFATETVYGLGANALDASAVARIFEAKGRPAHNPLIVHVADEDAARQVVSAWPDQAQRLAQAFWPGPLTLVLPRAANIPGLITAGLGSVGVRVPAHPVALELLRQARLPIAAPSANRSEALSPTRAEHVRLSLGAFLNPQRDIILDGGDCAVGIESTVLDLTQAPALLLRPGAVSRARIEAVIGPIHVLDAPSCAAPGHGAPQISPGLAARHYAPRARALRFDSRAELQAALALRGGCKYLHRLGVVTVGDFPLADPTHIEAHALPGGPEGYASGLYATLHALDDAGCAEIWIEMPPEHEEWRAVRDRLRRATVRG